MADIAIFGGTFNPFHIGHYEILTHITELDYIDRVLLLPDKIPPHKSCDLLASETDRINMCSLICNDFDKVQLCLVEFERKGKSYTIDTIKHLKTIYPEDNLYFVIGGDMLNTLDTWYSWQELIKLTSFIVFAREGVDSFEDDVNRMRSYGAKIIVIDKKITDISSTELRKSTFKSFLPSKVYEYIIGKGIYND